MTEVQQDSGLAARGTLGGNRDGPLNAEVVVRRLIEEGFSQGQLDVCDELIADEIVEHQDYGPGHPPSGRTFRIHVFDVLRVRGGRVVEHWGVPDRFGVLLQLGGNAPFIR